MTPDDPLAEELASVLGEMIGHPPRVIYGGPDSVPTSPQAVVGRVRVAPRSRWWLALILVVGIVGGGVLLHSAHFSGVPHRLTQAHGPYALVATMPDGTRLDITRRHRDTWAGVAQRRRGGWAILSAGTAYKQVAHHASAWWAPRKYQSEWLVIPLTLRAGDGTRMGTGRRSPGGTSTPSARASSQRQPLPDNGRQIPP